MDFKLEICCDTANSALSAMKAGADRIELCSGLPEGGTTSSFAAIAYAREHLEIKLHVLIRPRSGDFLYDDAEYEIMMNDIASCKKLGVDGIVAGILNPDGSIDRARTTEMVRAAHPLSFTFHRAFDMCSDPFKALEDVIRAGCDRLLTSGQNDKAVDGKNLIKKLVEAASGRIVIMPGSGITESNIENIARFTGAKEFHLTGRKVIESSMTFRRAEVHMGGIPGFNEYSRKEADPDLIRRIRVILAGI